LPVDDGSSGQYLQTNGSGVLSWQTIPASGDVTGPGSSANNRHGLILVVTQWK